MSLRLVFGFPAKAESGSQGELENKTSRLKLTKHASTIVPIDGGALSCPTAKL
jgi:hypothetical protein